MTVYFRHFLVAKHVSADLPNKTQALAVRGQRIANAGEHRGRGGRVTLDVRAEREADATGKADREPRVDVVAKLGLEDDDRSAEAAVLDRVHALGLAADVAGAAAA